ncbi:hypothetical protein BDE02_03G199700 [Populus trichocarpa]|nr:hypothetical protein BDE02_03G199700 [Populus trichocarpa]
MKEGAFPISTLRFPGQTEEMVTAHFSTSSFGPGPSQHRAPGQAFYLCPRPTTF